MKRVLYTPIVKRVFALMLAVILLFGLMPSLRLRAWAEPKEQSIAFEHPGDVTLRADAVEYTNAAAEVAVPEAEDGKGYGEGAITYTSDKTEVAEVEESTGKITVKGLGTAIITATKAEDENYAQATASYTLKIKKVQSPVVFEGIPAAVPFEADKTYSFPASGGSSSAPLVYTSGDGSIATVDDTGTITLKDRGTVTVTATKAEDEEFCEESGSYTLIVGKATGELSFSKDTVELSFTDSLTYRQVPVGPGTGTIHYSSSDPTVATVDESGMVSVLKPGETVITAHQDEDDDYLAADAQYTLVIGKRAQSLSFAASEKEAIYGTNYTGLFPDVAMAPGSGALSFSSSDESVAVVDKDTAQVTIVGVGETTITASKPEDADYAAAEASYKLKVSYEPMPAEPYTLSGPLSETGWYTGAVTFAPAGGYQISFTSNALDNTDWASLPVWSTEGENDVPVYLKNSGTGGITDGTSAHIKLDIMPPYDLGTEYEVGLATVLDYIFYGETCKVTLRAKDDASGVAKFNFSYHKVKGSFLSTNSWDVTGSLDAIKDTDGSYYCQIEVEPGFRVSSISFTAVDAAGKESPVFGPDSTIVAVDDQPAVLSFTYSDPSATDGTLRYYTGDAEVKAHIKEDNFYAEDAAISATKDGAPFALSPNWVYRGGESAYVNDPVFTLTEEGQYDFHLEYKDKSNHEAQLDSDTVIIDRTAPSIDTYLIPGSPYSFYNGVSVYNAGVDLHVEVTEANFRPENLVVTLETKNALGQDVTAEDIAAYLHDPANWTNSGDLHKATIRCETDAMYVLDVDYTDPAGNAAVNYGPMSFIVDLTAPANLKVEYGVSELDKVIETVTFGFYKAPVTVTVSADEDTTAIASFRYSYKKAAGVSDVNEEALDQLVYAEDIQVDGKTSTASFTIPKDALGPNNQFNGTLSVIAEDYGGHGISLDDTRRVVVDNLSPTRTVSYPTPDRLVDASDNQVDPSSYDSTLQENQDYTLYYAANTSVTIRVNEANFYPEDLEIALTKDGTAQTAAITWTDESPDLHVGTIALSGDGAYRFTISYSDRSTNQMSAYTSETLVVDTKAPVLKIQYNELAPVQTIDGIDYYNGERSATITVTEANFRPYLVVPAFGATDVTGAPVPVSDMTAYLADPANWTNDGDKHQIELSFTADANYNLELDCSDMVGHSAPHYGPDVFTIDRTPPENLKVSYSTNFVQQILSTVTFGYYQSPVTVTLSADDSTTPIHEFRYSYVKAVNSSVNAELLNAAIQEAKITRSGVTSTATFTIPKDALGPKNQFNGTVNFAAYDRVGNSALLDDAANNRIVVDNISPTRTVEYSVARVMDKDLNPVSSFDGKTQEGMNYSLFYKGPATVKIHVNEANFYAEDVAVALEKDGAPVAASVSWADESVDAHTGTMVLSEEGSYRFTVTYTDRSNNTMMIYSSERVVVDTTAPVISVSYSNSKVIHNIGGRSYYNDVQTATVTVIEKNFRAKDMAGSVSAVDVNGSPVAAANYAADLTDPAKWSTDGDKHSIALSFSADANYTLDLDCTDLAGNAAAHYGSDQFTVDRTAPGNLTISYSASKLQQVLSAVTFGFYDARMTVNISADDATSPILHFSYSYQKAPGVSGVNAELINAAIQEAQITRNGKTNTASFNIPREALGPNNQFNGTVSFTAYDRSENAGTLQDKQRVVVDNINPVGTLTLNQPASTADNVAYYAADVSAAIQITEANFFSEDVVVAVTKDGAAFPAAVTWADQNVDVHNGALTLTQEGSYEINVNYSDRSGNQMQPLYSGRFIIDKTDPVIKISKVRDSSANKNSPYDFSITAEDLNIDPDSFKPQLKLVRMNQEGRFETVTIDPGARAAVKEGSVYAFNLPDLPEDGLYTLSCSVADRAGHKTDKEQLEDGKDYQQVRFSINRNGSIFVLGSDYEQQLLDQYYVFAVYQDLVIEEINVDPIDDYTVTIDGARIAEGRGLKTSQTSNEGEWSIRRYVIDRKNFQDEGQYSIVVESTDKTGTKAYSDVKSLGFSFVVDQTPPVLTISGLEKGGRYRTDEQTVTVIPTDDGGRLRSMQVVVTDSSGAPLTDETGSDVSVRFQMEGEEFLEYLNDNGGMVSFTIPQGYHNQVHLICSDCALNDQGGTNEYDELFDRVTVSQNGFVIFFANKPAFFGSIAALIPAVGALVMFLKKKKEKKETART